MNDDANDFNPLRAAYAAVLEGESEGRETPGWYLGLAVADEAGYHQLKPGYGPYEDEPACRQHADELNERLGHSRRSAALVVASSMATQNREDGSPGMRRMCR